jgi:hypothetical protein
VGHIARCLGIATTLYVIIGAYRDARISRRKAQFYRYVTELHGKPADLGTTLAHFWLGQLFTRHGSDTQLDDWYRLTHGPTT